MKKLMLLVAVAMLAGCGDPNYVEPVADTEYQGKLHPPTDVDVTAEGYIPYR